jgi:hypothetical protein
VHPINADEQNVLAFVSAAKFIVGAGWCGKSGADQPDRQGYC